MKHLTQYLERYDIKHLKFCQKYSALSHIFSYLPRCLILGLNTFFFLYKYVSDGDVTVNVELGESMWIWTGDQKVIGSTPVVSCVACAKMGGEGEGEKRQSWEKIREPSLPNPPPFFPYAGNPTLFSLPPYSLPLWTPATQATPVARARICFFFSRLCHWLNGKLIANKNFYM